MVVAVVIVAVLTVVIAVGVVLCATGRIRRNPVIGLRVPALFASDEAWQIGHRAAIMPVGVAAVINIVISIMVAAVPGFGMVGVYVALGFLVLGVIVGAAIGSRAASHSAV